MSNETTGGESGNNIESPAEESGNNISGQPERWYVLFGITNRKLSKIYVDHLINSGNARMKGPLAKDEILKYHGNSMINDVTMLLKEGDDEWKPYREHNLEGRIEIGKILAGKIRRVKETGISGVAWKELYRRLLRHKVIAMSSVAALLLCVLGYNYYDRRPERIYNRIKESVALISSENSVGSAQSLGSGFIVGKDGLLVTNFHVISGLNAAFVKTGDGRIYVAEGVVYIDQENDIAVLKLRNEENKSFKSVKLGDSESVQIGETVYAIGNPAGMEFSLSEGIVSGKRENDPITKKERKLIQISAPISPGNSGGPVLDKKGRVIGIATLGSRNEFQNINFAVPIKKLGDYSKFGDIKYKFISAKPDWITLQLDYGQPVKRNGDSSELQLVNAAYDKNSITRLGSNRRVWFKAQMVRSSGYIDHRRDLIALIELNCAEKKFRYNIIIGREDDDERTVRSGFIENDNWKDVDTDDMEMVKKVCGYE